MFVKKTLEATRRKELEELFTLRYGKTMTLEDGLYDMYITKGYSAKRIAAMCYMSNKTVVDWLKEMGIYRKFSTPREIKVG